MAFIRLARASANPYASVTVCTSHEHKRTPRAGLEPANCERWTARRETSFPSSAYRAQVSILASPGYEPKAGPARPMSRILATGFRAVKRSLRELAE